MGAFTEMAIATLETSTTLETDTGRAHAISHQKRRARREHQQTARTARANMGTGTGKERRVGKDTSEGSPVQRALDQSESYGESERWSEDDFIYEGDSWLGEA